MVEECTCIDESRHAVKSEKLIAPYDVRNSDPVEHLRDKRNHIETPVFWYVFVRDLCFSGLSAPLAIVHINRGEGVDAGKV